MMSLARQIVAQRRSLSGVKPLKEDKPQGTKDHVKYINMSSKKVNNKKVKQLKNDNKMMG
ncbi:unnamed protein product [Citrullus colocynthis]|uniref:Uncharacterized protein n=1 Tax=Citrullus colocynthis TaxID=252529 RepID=A0ABP0YBY4_9ROSI